MLADLRRLSCQAVLTLRCGPRTSNQDCSLPACCLQLAPQLRHITCGCVYSDKPLIAKFDLGRVKQHQLHAGTWPRQVWDRHLGSGRLYHAQCNAACRHIGEGHWEALHCCHPPVIGLSPACHPPVTCAVTLLSPCCHPTVTLMLTP